MGRPLEKPSETSLQQAFQFTHEYRVEIKAQGDWMTEGGGMEHLLKVPNPLVHCTHKTYSIIDHFSLHKTRLLAPHPTTFVFSNYFLHGYLHGKFKSIE